MLKPSKDTIQSMEVYPGCHGQEHQSPKSVTLIDMTMDFFDKVLAKWSQIALYIVLWESSMAWHVITRQGYTMSKSPNILSQDWHIL